MIVSLIVAASTNNVIGKNNELPWTLPVDMKFFKNTTWGMPVIMGRKTFESMGGKALPGRRNIIITRQNDFDKEGVRVVNSLAEAITAATDTDCNEAFVIGGGVIFKEAIDKADRIYMTRVHATIDGDVFFPDIDEHKWKLVSKRDCYKDEKHKYDFSFETWEKK
jgi:dihydrofolate reductase